MFNAINQFLSTRSPGYLYLIATILIAIVGTVDLVTGREISFSFFYLLPIFVVTWYCRRGAGYLASAIAAVVWLSVDYASGHIYSHFLINYWNAVVRLAFFMTTTYLLASLKQHFLIEQHLARTDELTGLYSARAFKDFASKLLEVSKRHAHPFVLAYIDLDNFKHVNDNLGHSEGDAALRAVGATLQKSVRSSDLVGRLGGDEFAIAMPETGLAAAQVAFAKIHHELTSNKELARWPIGFSIGIAVFVTAPANLDDALNIADRMMYRVKASGKNRVLIEEYNAPLDTTYQRAFEK